MVSGVSPCKEFKMTNRDRFKLVFFKHLGICRLEKPELYNWPENEIQTIIGRLNKAIDNGSFNKDSESFKRACKELQIKHTYKDIKEFLESDSLDSEFMESRE